MIILISLILIAVGGLVVIMNWSIPIQYYSGRSKGKSKSVIPVVGGIALMLGFYLSDIDSLKRYFWLPFILDVGSLPTLLMFAWRLTKKRM